MKMLELLSGLTIHVDLIAKLVPRLEAVYMSVRRLMVGHMRDVAYENTSLEMVVDIVDPRGHRAVLRRRLGVRFLRPDPGIIRELAWGDGKPLVWYTASGARKLSTEREGSKSVVLLSLDHRPKRGERTVVRSRRVLQDAFRRRLEYFEAFVERPTRRLSVKVVFPRTRPPREAHVVASPPGQTIRRLRVRYGREGRPFLFWRDQQPRLFTHYSLRWSW